MAGGLDTPLLPKAHGGLRRKRTLRRLQTFQQTHRTFCTNLEICARVAFWVIAFGLPVYSLPAYRLAFGDGRTVTVGRRTVQMCSGADLGRMVNMAAPGELPRLVRYEAAMGDFDQNDPALVWCGVLPQGYAAYWPNVAVMIVFTVYKNTGATVKLAWQGIMGTLCATLNVYIMTYLFPSGARGHVCSRAEQRHHTCIEGTMVYDDPNYCKRLCWADVFVVLFFFLISNAEVNTIKFGMSWHVYFMMTFMDPSRGPNRGMIPTGIADVDWDDEATIVNLTSIVGAVLAVLATLAPYPLLNITLVDDNAIGMCHSSRGLLADSIDYYCGSRATEFADIRQRSSSVKDKQAALWTAYDAFAKSEPASSDLGSENLFVFALSVWARQITDFADDIGTMEQAAERHRMGFCARVLQIALDGVRDTWCIHNMLDADHIRFCMRNFLSIAICFTLGYYLDGAVFTRYDSTMPGTLALLVSRFSGSAFQNNLRRLLGVSLGKVLPILIFAAVGLAPSGSSLRFIIHASSLALYTFSFTYMYYTSLQWSSVGCCIAAFGLGSLLTITYIDPTQIFAARYMEIGQVTMAIVVQMCVDGLLSRQAPRDLAFGCLLKLTDSVKRCYAAFFDGNMPLLAQSAAHARTHYRTAQDLVPDCSPNMEVVPGARTPFKVDLYTDALDEIRMLRSDVNILLLATKVWTARSSEEIYAAPIMELMLRPEAMGIIGQDFSETIEVAMAMLCHLVEHSSEEDVKLQRVYDLEATNVIAELDGVDKYHDELNSLRLAEQASVFGDQEREVLSDARVRLSVILQVLKNSNVHLGNIVRLCFKERT